MAARGEGRGMPRRPTARTAALALAALLAMALVAELAPGQGAGGDWRMAIDSRTAGVDPAWGAFDTSGPTLADVDGDGEAEIVDQNRDGRVVVVTADGTVRAQLRTTIPPYWGAQPMNAVAVTEDNLFVANSAGFVTRFHLESAGRGEWEFRKVWEHQLTKHGNPSMDGGVAVADLDGDGSLEVLAQTETPGIYALNARDGSIAWSHPLGGGDASPVAHDVDGDGRPEAIFVSDGGHVTLVDGAGKVRWNAWVGRHVGPGSITAMPLVSDLDGDGRAEIVVCARDAHDAVNFAANHLAIVALDSAGRERWVLRPEWAHPLCDSQMVAADVDGDGRKEIFGMDWNTMGHKPGNWESLGPAHVFSLTAEGQERWHRTVENWWSDDDTALVDADGDGDLEVLAVGVSQGRDGLFVLDARTGEVQAHASAWPYRVQRGPEVEDLDGDGRAEWVVSVGAMAEGTLGGGFLVFDGQGREGVAPLPPDPAPAPPRREAPEDDEADEDEGDDAPGNRPERDPPRPRGRGLGGLLRAIGL